MPGRQAGEITVTYRYLREDDRNVEGGGQVMAVCPCCGCGDEIYERDAVLATNRVIRFELLDGKLEGRLYDDGEVHWDSRTHWVAERRYECRNCDVAFLEPRLMSIAPVPGVTDWEGLAALLAARSKGLKVPWDLWLGERYVARLYREWLEYWQGERR